MSTEVHPTALVDPKAELGVDVYVGPFALIEAGVAVGDRCHIGPYSRLAGQTSIGPENRFESHCSVGAPPQDLKYEGEPTRLEIGRGNVFREFVTLHRGTPGGGALTTIGDSSLFMANAHVAHDCHVGSKTIFANAATLAGHVDVGDEASIGAFSAVHQFCRVGQHAFLGGFTVATKDCLPFMRTVGSRPSRCFGPNSIGLERKGFSEDRRRAIKRAWRYLHSPKMNAAAAVEVIREELGGQEDVDMLLDFIATAQRGIILSRG
ncbi:MAG: acyl-ACP--UDP-N-acetylglucosamine O-acyltransferase [bacterium]|nr:acyl-ACP--UDP-N-acetylglucosamine O-acyltransferase [bacterium]